MSVTFHGKEYRTVAERLNLLVADTEGNYSINTEIIDRSDNDVVIKATLDVIDKGSWTGTAHEVKNDSLVNTSSHIENCETSAIGRALASAGYGGTEFCSADELANALKNQDNSAVNKYKNDKKKNEKVTDKEDWDV
tara:strand:+ start:102 stop:512 length:411 start_codon:yes stop_codon:yes gene_type:complete